MKRKSVLFAAEMELFSSVGYSDARKLLSMPDAKRKLEHFGNSAGGELSSLLLSGAKSSAIRAAEGFLPSATVIVPIEVTIEVNADQTFMEQMAGSAFLEITNDLERFPHRSGRWQFQPQLIKWKRATNDDYLSVGRILSYAAKHDLEMCSLEELLALVRVVPFISGLWKAVCAIGTGYEEYLTEPDPEVWFRDGTYRYYPYIIGARCLGKEDGRELVLQKAGISMPLEQQAPHLWRVSDGWFLAKKKIEK